MIQEKSITSNKQAAPKAAAIAGIVFSVLLIISFTLFLKSLPATMQDSGAWLFAQGNSILLGLNLVPFAGIAFLWFMGVVRDRLGTHEDRFIGTVFFGSGLLFIAMLFSVAATAGAIILMYLNEPARLLASGFYSFGHRITSVILNTYMLKMAGVFMISTSTLFLRSKSIPTWMAYLGYALAAIMLLRISHLDRFGWISLSFPSWVFLISIYILWENYNKKPEPTLK